MPSSGYQLLYKKSVDKDLRKLPTSIRKQIINKIQMLSDSPYMVGSVKLLGANNLYRIRHSNYRIIYQIKDSQLVVLVVKVGHRKEIYRDF